MGGAGDDLHALLAAELGQGFAVHGDYGLVSSADDQEGGGLDPREGLAGQVWAAAAGDYGAYVVRRFRGGYQGCASAGAGAEVTDWQTAGVGLGAEPLRRCQEALR